MLQTKTLLSKQIEDPPNCMLCLDFYTFDTSFKNIIIFPNFEVFALHIRGSAESQNIFVAKESETCQKNFRSKKFTALFAKYT